MRLKVTHRTTYCYSSPAWSSQNELRLAPEQNLRQVPDQLELTTAPGAKLSEMRDLFGNLVHSFEVEEKHETLSILAESNVTTQEIPFLTHQAKNVPLSETAPIEDHEELHEFLVDSTFVKSDQAIWRDAIDIHLNCGSTYGIVIEALSDHIFENYEYRDQKVHTMTTASQVRQNGGGTCQDFSHLLLGYCRALGIPGRYLSGYLYDPGLDGKHAPELIGAESTHAWVEVYVPGVGWVGIDPTNQCWVDERYVSLAYGRDYHDVAPVRGSLLGGGKHRTLEVEVKVNALPDLQ